jgi:DegV family protein with EDD domain
MPNPHMLLQTYEKLAGEGATQILSIHISKSLSSVTDSAHPAANQSPVPVTVFDSGTLSLGTGFLVWEAAKAAAAGRSVQDILALIQDQAQRTRVFAALDTMEFIRRSGRVSRLVATVGTLLQMKPLLKMHAGNPTAERVRTSKAAIKRLVALLQEQLPLEKVALVHTHALDRVKDLRDKSRHLLPAGDILSVDITPVFGTHLGPGAVGFACVSAREEKGDDTQ